MNVIRMGFGIQHCPQPETGTPKTGGGRVPSKHQNKPLLHDVKTQKETIT